MLFNSWEFLLLFLPSIFAIYFFLSHIGFPGTARLSLILANLFFYGYWDVSYLALIMLLIVINYIIGYKLGEDYNLNKQSIRSKFFLWSGIIFNLSLLCYYKYIDFFITNINFIFHYNISLSNIVLPLAISFFTFQQIAYLVDSYRGNTKEYNFLTYLLFVTFFPQLIAGPIVHHKEMMPQFSYPRKVTPSYKNIFNGLFIFGIGLFKKVAIADTFATFAIAGFDSKQILDFYSAWGTSLSYTFQLYFDFSGYCDMAIGSALLFNIHLPLNFNSPYKARDIQDFWRRWHITLGRFLRNYLYIPLGGNRDSALKVAMNVMITFILGGLWHGASWMFVIWGALHGFAIVILRIWKNIKLPLPNCIAWLLTFAFVNFAWVFFRANTLSDAMRVLRGMIDFQSIFSLKIADIPTANLAWGGWFSDKLLFYLSPGLVSNIICYICLTLGFFIIFRDNVYEMSANIKVGYKMIWGAAFFSIGIYYTLATTSTIFLYFNF